MNSNENEGEIDEARRALKLILERPNARTEPKEGDLIRDYDQWLDGGAMKKYTGRTEYTFADGTSVDFILSLPGYYTISLASGTIMTVTEDKEDLIWHRSKRRSDQ
jgi:hypothetical protein